MKDLRLEASVKIDLDVCFVDEYLEFLKSLNGGWHSRPNNENEISSLVNSCSFGNLLSTNIREETSKNYIIHLLYDIEQIIKTLCTEMGQLDSGKWTEMEKRTIHNLYTCLETQCKNLRRKDAATLW